MLPATTNASASATSHFHPVFVSAVNGTADNFIPSLYTKFSSFTTGALNTAWSMTKLPTSNFVAAL